MNKNKIIKFTKNIFKDIFKNLKEFIIGTIFISLAIFIFSGSFIGITYLLGLIMMYVFPLKQFQDIAEICQLGGAGLFIIGAIICVIYYDFKGIKSFIKWIIRCWKESEME